MFKSPSRLNMTFSNRSTVPSGASTLDSFAFIPRLKGKCLKFFAKAIAHLPVTCILSQQEV